MDICIFFRATILIQNFTLYRHLSKFFYVMDSLDLGWRTRAQLLLLHGNNAAAVDSIIDQKIQMGEYRAHPDCPEEESATLYYVMVDLSRLHADEVEERTEISADVALDLGSEVGYL